MAYRITYGPAGPASQRKRQFLRKLFVKFVVAALIVGLRFTGIGEQIQQWLIPGDAVVTVAAWEDLTGDIVAGESVGAAVETFCRRIIEDAKVS